MKTVTVNLLIHNIRILLSKFPSADGAFLLYGLSHRYMKHIFGEEWIKQFTVGMCSDISRQNQSGRQFFKAESESQDERFRHQERIQHIAELLFNLQDVEGIDDRVADLAAGKIESTYSELEAGGFLAKRGLNFRFVNTSGIKGLDYDAEIQLPDTTKVNCEIKCKIEESQLSKSGIITRLNDARKQLPKGEPAIIFLKIPESWTLQEDIAAVFHEALSDFFRSTTRIVAVVVCWEEVNLEVNGPSALILYKFRVEINLGLPNPTEAIVVFLDRLALAYGQFEPRWLPFHRLIESR